MSKVRKEDVEARLAELARLDAPALRRLWQEHYGCPAPKRTRADFLRRAIAYRIQEKAYGGLRPATVRRLKRLAEELAASGRITATPASQLQPGARLMREWNGETHVVDVAEDGYRWRGRTYRSLSVIAREITGARWSGPRFFGLNGKRRVSEGDD